MDQRKNQNQSKAEGCSKCDFDVAHTETRGTTHGRLIFAGAIFGSPNIGPDDVAPTQASSSSVLGSMVCLLGNFLVDIDTDRVRSWEVWV